MTDTSARILTGILMVLLVGVGGCTVYRTDGPPQAKSQDIYVCHRGQTLRVPDGSVRAHLDHGDHIGACDPDPSSADEDG